jgi:hypothetical protein
MSYTDNVANFLGSLGSFYDAVPVEDLELLVGNVLERVRSQPGSPLSSSPLGKQNALTSSDMVIARLDPMKVNEFNFSSSSSSSSSCSSSSLKDYDWEAGYVVSGLCYLLTTRFSFWWEIL